MSWMKRRKRYGWVPVVVAMAFSLPGATTSTKKTAQRISFRTMKPLAAHFDTQQEAAATEKTLRQLGCATEFKKHHGHVDVSYECKYWRSLTLTNRAEVVNWSKWLTSNGFAVVQNSPGKDHKETVQYYLKDWKTLHVHEPTASKAHVAMFKMLGCEVTVAKHDGHDDVKVRCATSRTIGVPSHAEAHAWMKVLQKLGFVTVHEH